MATIKKTELTLEPQLCYTVSALKVNGKLMETYEVRELAENLVGKHIVDVLVKDCNLGISDKIKLFESIMANRTEFEYVLSSVGNLLLSVEKAEI
jgi:hypothetical protein